MRRKSTSHTLSQAQGRDTARLRANDVGQASTALVDCIFKQKLRQLSTNLERETRRHANTCVDFPQPVSPEMSTTCRENAQVQPLITQRFGSRRWGAIQTKYK